MSSESIRVDPLAEPAHVIDKVRIHAGTEGFPQHLQPIFANANRDEPVSGCF